MVMPNFCMLISKSLKLAVKDSVHDGCAFNLSGSITLKNSGPSTENYYIFLCCFLCCFVLFVKWSYYLSIVKKKLIRDYSKKLIVKQVILSLE